MWKRATSWPGLQRRGLAFASGGLGAVHALAYAVGTEFKQAHGRSNAIMLPHIMKYNIPGNPAKFADIAALMGEDIDGLTDREAAQLAVEAVEDLLTTSTFRFTCVTTASRRTIFRSSWKGA